jgi:hypothetical protein
MIKDGDTAREMTAAEHEQWQQDAAAAQTAAAAQAAAADAKAKALASARSKLAALGLTQAEVAALLGG